jgi:hypothetical protein
MDAMQPRAQEEAVSVEERVAAALQENRILILGTEVLLGFQFSAIFQTGFDRLGEIERALLLGCHGLLVVVLTLLLAPTPFHRIAYGGEDVRPVADFTHFIVKIALLPLAVVTGLDVFIVVSHGANQTIGIVAGAILTIIVLALWYGAGWIARRPREWVEAMDQRRPPEEEEPMSERIDRLLSEARIILPGVQALLGFQFTVTLMDAFERLSPLSTHVHLAALCAMAIAAALLMAPAAYHRIATRGDAAPDVLVFANRSILTAMLALSIGLSADIFVVIEKTLGSLAAGVAGALLAESAMLGLWFGFPLLRRSRS